MAILISSDKGWVVCHESFIKNMYKKTNHLDETKSYVLNPMLFDIRIPFYKKREGNCGNKTFPGEIDMVQKAYEVLCSLYLSLNEIAKNLQPTNNHSAQSLANRFYSQLACHPEVNFLGGNNSEVPIVAKVGNGTYLIPENSLFYCYDVKDISEHLKDLQFDFILMDPPWWNKFIRRKRKKNSKFGYNMIYNKDLIDIPINSLLRNDGLIAVWCTSAPSHIKAIITELFPAWQIEYLTQWFWLKITKLGEPVCEFSQLLKKQPFERIIFGFKSNMIRPYPNPEKEKVLMSVPSAIHSHKPPLCDLLKACLPNKPKCLELFARYLLPGWTSYGHEVLKLQHLSLYSEGEPSQKN